MIHSVATFASSRTSRTALLPLVDKYRFANSFEFVFFATISRTVRGRTRFRIAVTVAARLTTGALFGVTGCNGWLLRCVPLPLSVRLPVNSLCNRFSATATGATGVSTSEISLATVGTFRSFRYDASSAEAAPSIIARANAPPSSQCLRCRSFASIFSSGTTGRADSRVRSSSKCGCAAGKEASTDLLKLCSFIFQLQ